MSNLNLTPVQSANDSSSDFKLRWYPETDTFKFSTTLFGQLGLSDKGLQQFNGEDGVYLGVRLEENSVFLKRKKGFNKHPQFKNKSLSNALKDYGFLGKEIESKQGIDLDLEYADLLQLQEDGEKFPVYKIKPEGVLPRYEEEIEEGNLTGWKTEDMPKSFSKPDELKEEETNVEEPSKESTGNLYEQSLNTGKEDSESKF